MQFERRNDRSGFAALLVLSTLLFACGGNSARIDAAKGLTGDAAAGKTLYGANCARCHGDDGRTGSARRNVPSVASTNPDKALDTMLSGEDAMPSFSSLSDQNLADILAYVKTL